MVWRCGAVVAAYLFFLLAAVCTFFPLAVCCAVQRCVYTFSVSLSLGGGRCGVLLACTYFSICVSLGGVPLTSFSLCVSLWRWCIVMYRFYV